MSLKPDAQRTSQRVRQEPLLPSAFMSALAEELAWHGNREDLVPPSMYVAGDFDQAAEVLGATATHVVGSGTCAPGAVRRMLRLCGPLAQEGWDMLCAVADGHLRYGVIACGDDRGPGRRPPDTLCPPEPGFAGIRIWEPTKGIVAVHVASDNMLRAEPCRAAWPEPSPLARLVAVATEHGIDGAQVHLTRLFDRALAKPTGALVAVVPQSWTGEWPCEDAIVLRTPIDLPQLAVNADTDAPSRVVVAQYEGLAAAMIRDDGVVVFDEAARLRAYRWFVPFSPGGEQLSGGARERAFRALEGLVSTGALCAAFIQSGDGTMSIVRGPAASAPLRANAMA